MFILTSSKGGKDKKTDFFHRPASPVSLAGRRDKPAGNKSNESNQSNYSETGRTAAPQLKLKLFSGYTPTGMKARPQPLYAPYGTADQ